MRTLVAIAAALVGSLVTGCSTMALQGSRIERPVAPAQGSARSEQTSAPADVQTLVVDGLRVSFQAADVVRAEAPRPPLRLRLVFEPPALGYSFAPGEVRLRAADGREFAPGVSGPGHYERGTCRLATHGGGDDSPFRFLARGSCFELEFPVAVSPQARMELVLGGLARGRRRLEPVRLLVVHRSWRAIDRLYWLEALGTFLEAATVAR